MHQTRRLVLAFSLSFTKKHYPTLKAIGYGEGYLRIVLVQESIILAVLGFIPGFGASLLLYHFAYKAALLPIAMTTHRALMILLLTIIMCNGSAMVAMRKLTTADPADIF